MPRSPLVQAALFAVAALAVRLVGIDARSLWVDESFSAWLAAQPADAIVEYRDYHPPLYYLLLKAWGGLGAWAQSDAGVRLPSAIASALSVGLAVWLVRRLALPGAWLVGALLATSSLSVWYAQEARMYATAGLAVLGAAGALAIAAGCADRQPPLRRAAVWLGYLLCAIAAVYLHYDAVGLLGLLNAAFLVLLARGSGWRALGPWVLVNALLVAAYWPHFPRLLDTLARGEGLHTLQSVEARLAWLGPVVPLALGLAVLGLVATALVVRRRRPSPQALALSAGVAGWLCLNLVELDPFGASLKRHAAVVLPIALIALGVLASRLRRRWQLLLVAAGLPALLMTLFVHPKEDWRGAAALLRAEARPGDGIVFYRPWVFRGLERYYRFEGPVLPANAPGDLAPLSASPDWQARRVWLVESETVEPPTLAPHVPGGRVQLLERQLDRVAVRLYAPHAP